MSDVPRRCRGTSIRIRSIPMLLAVIAALGSGSLGCAGEDETIDHAARLQTTPPRTPEAPPVRGGGDGGAGFGSGPVSAGPRQPPNADDTGGEGTVPPLAEMPRSPAGLPMMPVVIKGRRYLMELALDETARRRGLGGRRTLASDRGMMFVHPRPEIQGYWMKDCFMDIDIAYVDALGRVTATYRMKKEPPRRPDESITAYQRRLPSYSSRRAAVLALEFAPGTLDRLDLRPGEKIDLDITALRAISKE